MKCHETDEGSTKMCHCGHNDASRRPVLSVTDSAGNSHAEQESEPSSHRPAISRSATYSLPNQVYTIHT